MTSRLNPTIAGIPLAALASPPTPAELGALIASMPFEKQAEFIGEWRQGLSDSNANFDAAVIGLAKAIHDHDIYFGDEYAAGFIYNIQVAIEGSGA
jgi:hypothetical protein